jgi:hypothetical protein
VACVTCVIDDSIRDQVLIPENPLTLLPSLPAFAAAPPFFVAANKSRANEVKAVQEVIPTGERTPRK